MSELPNPARTATPVLRAPGYLPLISNLPIGFRIGALAALAALAVALIMAAYLLGDRRIAGGLDRQAAYAAMLDAQHEVESQALQMRRAEKDFLLRRDLKYAAGYAKARAAALGAIDNLAKREEAGPIASKLAALRDGIVRHGQQFDDVVRRAQALGLDEKLGLEGALRNAVHSAEKAVLAQSGRDDLLVKMLMMRRHEKDFMLRGNSKYVGDVEKRQAEFEKLLQTGSMAAEQRAQVGQDVATYVRDFKAYAAAAQEQAAAIKRLSQIFGEIEPLFDEFQRFARDAAKKADDDIAAERGRGRVAMLAAGGFTFALAVVFAFFIGRGISAPLNRIVDVMRRLAGNELAIAIPAVTYKDEIGAMARAVQVFKDNAIENARLQQEAEAARERELKQKEEQRRLEEEAARAEERRRREAEEAKHRAEEERRAGQERARLEAERQRKAEMHALADGFEASVKAVVETVSSSASEMQGSATAMSATAEETSRQATAVAA
ncbi:MAG: HAMP domain-containing protein, partial [Alphaproteobacteria bacterium]|nr:HAMP domain-containing protein [Alphaproteobacteria bacterium]